MLPKDYARPALDKQRLGQLIDMIGNIRVGDAEARSRDVIGRVYEYSLSQFASAEGTLAALRDTLLPKLISGEIRLEEAASIKRGGALMDHFGRLADHHLSIPIRPDEDGFTGRECPLSDCEGYFKSSSVLDLMAVTLRATARTAGILQRTTTSRRESRSSMPNRLPCGNTPTQSART